MIRTLSLLGASALLASGAVTAQTLTSPDPAKPARVVYVTVTDRNGVPIEDLTPADFEVKEGGKVVQVVHAGISDDPVQIALIVDDNGTGIFRSALTRFVQRMAGRAAMSLSSVTGQTMKIVDYTMDAEAVLDGLSTLNARPGTPDGGQLLEGISEAARELRRRSAKRPVIIALTVGGEEHSTAHSDDVLNQLRQSGAVLHVFSVARSALRATVDPARPSALLQENMHLSRVLGDGPKQSGGRHESIVAATGSLLGLQNLVSEFSQQYRIAYDLPPGAKRSDRLNVSVKRRGLQVRAPSRIPN
jgi:hypothetical protein